jgi:DNA-binding transcriptional regulator YiaG
MTGPGQKPLSATLRRLRKAARLSNAVVAQRLGTSTRRPSDPETGKGVPRETEAGALSGLYQASRAARRSWRRWPGTCATSHPRPGRAGSGY